MGEPDPQVSGPPVAPPEDPGGSRRAPEQAELVPPLIYDHLASTWDEYYAWLTGADGGDDNGAAEGPAQ